MKASRNGVGSTAPALTRTEIPVMAHQIVPVPSTIRKNLIGQRFGCLVVIGFSHRDRFGKAMWVCRCDCGNETVVVRSNLCSGSTVGCGCVRANQLKTH